MWYVICDVGYVICDICLYRNLFRGCESASDYYSDYDDYSLVLTAEWAGWLCFCRSRQVTMSMRMKVQAMIGEEASDSKKSPVFWLMPRYGMYESLDVRSSCMQSDCANVQKLSIGNGRSEACILAYSFCFCLQVEGEAEKAWLLFASEFQTPKRFVATGHRRRSRSRHMDHGGVMCEGKPLCREPPVCKTQAILFNWTLILIIHMMCMIMFNYDKCTLCVILIIVDIYIIYASMLWCQYVYLKRIFVWMYKSI